MARQQTDGDTNPGATHPDYDVDLPVLPPPSESAAARARRRRRRQTATFAVFFLIVLGIGAIAVAAFQGRIDLPIGTGKPPPLPVCPTTSPTAQPFDVTSVHVFNASSRNGWAMIVARELQKRGFRVPTTPSNDPLRAKVTTAAVIRHGANGLLAAKTLASVIAGKVTLVQDKRPGEDVDLVLGATFTFKPVPAPSKSKTPTPAATCTTA